MPDQTRIVSPHFRPHTVRAEDGTLLHPPDDWELLPPGDAALTRRVKKAGPSWTVQVKKGRKTFSQGVWAPAAIIAQERRAVERVRQDPSHQRKQKNAQQRRERQHRDYIREFRAAVRAFLHFDERHRALAEQLAEAVSAHATPVGSGTVARTRRIPIGERAEAAVIAWMRHNTSAYDDMKVPRVKGARRALRRQIADRSREILSRYRTGEDFVLDSCPLYRALTASTTNAP